MPAAGDGLSTERRRLASASSIVNVLAGHVDDVIQFRSWNLPSWLTRLGIPPGWQIGHLANTPVEPSRIAVYGPQPDGGWDGCETISVFGFTGMPPADVVRDSADCTLRDLGAAGITTHLLDMPLMSKATAVRSSGFFGAAGLWVWAQYSTYVAGSLEPGHGRLVQQAVFIESNSRARLSADVDRLNDSVYRAFATSVAGP
jgi:hypothetical protein